MIIRLSILSVCVILGLTTAALQAEDAQQQFDSLFKEKIEKAKASSSKKDDLELAKNLLLYLEYDDLSKEFKILISKAARDLAANAPGAASTVEKAQQALKELGHVDQGDPANENKTKNDIEALKQKVDALNKALGRTPAAQRPKAQQALFDALLELGAAYDNDLQITEALSTYRRAYSLSRVLRSPPAVLRVRELMASVQAKQQAYKQAKVYKDEYEQNPTPQGAKQLAELYLIQLNSPESALPYARKSGDAKLKKHLEHLAKKDRSKVSNEELIELAIWLRERSDKEPDFAKEKIYLQAREIIMQVLSRRRTEGAISTMKMKMTMDRIQRYLKGRGIE